MSDPIKAHRATIPLLVYVAAVAFMSGWVTGFLMKAIQVGWILDGYLNLK